MREAGRHYELRARILVDNSKWEFFNLVSEDGLEIEGDFYSAKEDAAEAIANGGIAKNTCIKEWIWNYKKRVNGKTSTFEVVDLYLPAPDSIFNLLY